MLGLVDNPLRSPTTMAALFDAMAKRAPADQPFFENSTGKWLGVSFGGFAQRARACGLAAMSSGGKKQDVACVLAGASIDWMSVDIGLQSVGIIVAGIYPTEAPSKVSYYLNDCGAKFVFVDTADQLEKLVQVWPECPKLRLVITFDDALAEQSNDPRIRSFTQWLASGEAENARSQGQWDLYREQVQPTDIAMLIYTSGTSGPPKAAMISHANVVFQIRESSSYYPFEHGWVRPAYLPLCHVAERMFTYYAMYTGVSSYFVDDPNLLGSMMVETRPHFILGVPRVYEKLFSAAKDWVNQATDLQQSEYAAALNIGEEIAETVLSGNTPSVQLLDAHAEHTAGIIQEMRNSIGLSRVKVLVSGGARFDPKLLRWYLSIGIPMLEMYGMTECGMIATNSVNRVREGTVGTVCEFGDVKLSEIGEILVRGEHVFAGYLNKPEHTAEALSGGWFHTGDIGAFDDEGNLRIVDRIKDIIITSGGKNITPSEVAGKVKQSAIISDVVIVGDGQKFISALILLNRPEAESVACAGGSVSPPYRQLCELACVRTKVDQAIENANEHLSRVEQIKAYRIIPTEFTPNSEEMTPTMKIKRRVILSNWAELVEDIYREVQADAG